MSKNGTDMTKKKQENGKRGIKQKKKRKTSKAQK